MGQKTKDNKWYKDEICKLIKGLEDNKKLHFLWTFIKKYVSK